MGAKLTFQDIQNDELAPSKIVSSPNINVSTGSGAPVYSTQGGSIYLDSTAGTLYINNSGASGSTWWGVSSSSGNIQSNHYRKQTLTGVTVASSAVSAPQIGDLVGIYGAGTWATSGTMALTKTAAAGGGNKSAAWVAGGSTVATSISTAELFNGATWSATGALTQSKSDLNGSGSQNAGWLAGGGPSTATAVSITELFNGATWATSGTLTITIEDASSLGTANAALIAGGNGAASTSVSITELFNGATWATSGTLSSSKASLVGAGSQNAGLVVTGRVGGATNVSSTELFNGSTWTLSGVFSITDSLTSGSGSQNAAFSAGGLTSGSSSFVFNGSTWAASGTLSAVKQGCTGAGSQTGLVAGGTGAGSPLNVTELHSQSTYRKVYSRYVKTAKNLGINLGSNNILLEGYDTTTTYPPNVFLVLNPLLNTAVANETDLSGTFSISSIAGSGSSWGYTLNTATSMLQLMPGMILISSGATSSVNNGTFIINFVNNTGPTITVTNAAGVAQLTPAGTVKLIGSLIVKTVVSQQDIVIGTTDASGFITLIKTPIASSVLARLR